MPKKISHKQRQKPRKYSENGTRRFREKPINEKWQCRICQTMNEASYAFCVQCYLGLHYYAYVNMHMFVESDYSYEQVYYQTQSRDPLSETSSNCSHES